MVYSCVVFFLFLIYCYGFCHTELVLVKYGNKNSYQKNYRVLHHGLPHQGDRNYDGNYGKKKSDKIKTKPQQPPAKPTQPPVKPSQPNPKIEIYREKTHCYRDFFFGLLFFALPMTIWSLILFIHL